MKMKQKNLGLIFISIIVVLLIVGCTVNIIFACKSGDNANIFTTIGGWIGFLATAGVGVITLLQNRKYEQRTSRQYEIDNLYKARDVIYANYKALSEKNRVIEIIAEYYKMKNNAYDKNIYISSLYAFRVMIADLSDMCAAQSNDLYNLRYNLPKAITIYEGLSQLKISLMRILPAQSNDLEQQKLDKKCGEQYDAIKNDYVIMLIDIDNKIEKLLEYKKYSDFEKSIVQLKNIDEKTEQLNKLIKKYNEETEKWTS